MGTDTMNLVVYIPPSYNIEDHTDELIACILEHGWGDDLHLQTLILVFNDFHKGRGYLRISMMEDDFPSYEVDFLYFSIIKEFISDTKYNNFVCEGIGNIHSDDQEMINISANKDFMNAIFPKGEYSKEICDENCNSCSLLLKPNARILSFIFNELDQKLGNEVYKIVQKYCPNLTCCFDCHVDDFCHVEKCKIIKFIEDKNANKTD